MAVSGAEAAPRRHPRGCGLRGGSSQGGFLLVEVLLAMVLLGVGLSAAVVLLAEAVRVMERADILAQGAPVVAGEALFVPGMADGRARRPSLELEWWWDDNGLRVVQRRAEGAPEMARFIRVPWDRPSPVPPREETGP